MLKLVRPEIMEHSNHRLKGGVLLFTPLSTRVVSVVIVLLIAIALLFLSTAKFSRKETVSGWLMPESGLIRAVAIRGGLVDKLFVREGEIVEPGSPLASMRLSSNLPSGDSGQTLQAAFEQLAVAQEKQANAELVRLKNEETQLVSFINGLNGELQDLGRQIELQRESVNLANNEVNRSESIVARGLLSKKDFVVRQGTALKAKQDLARLEQSSTNLKRQLKDARLRLEATPALVSTASANAEAAKASLVERATIMQAQNSYIITSPIKARVALLPFHQGQNVPASANLAVLMPTESALVAELFIPSRAIANIQIGQEARLLYQAFPHQRFGVGIAKISKISGAALTPDEIAISGMVMKESVFRVTAAIHSQSIETYGTPTPLQPGMLLEANIIIDRRSLLEWLFDPLFASGRK